MRNKLIITAAVLAALNLMILDGIIDNECRIHHPIRCEYNLNTDARVCR